MVGVLVNMVWLPRSGLQGSLLSVLGRCWDNLVIILAHFGTIWDHFGRSKIFSTPSKPLESLRASSQIRVLAWKLMSIWALEPFEGIQSYVCEGLGAMTGLLWITSDDFLTILRSFGVITSCDFSIQKLIIMQTHIYQNLFKIIGFYDGFCTLSYIVMWYDLF